MIIMVTAMPRQSRIEAPGALHHVIIRGIKRKAIFKDDADRNEFIEMNTIRDDNAWLPKGWI